ncbi:hypothetical protein VP141O351_P0018 [Vibrio phage 141O35-1]|nr:hypothetical protein VP141O351_P0018 [Vibrio phage 141O35-1]
MTESSIAQYSYTVYLHSIFTPVNTTRSETL